VLRALLLTALLVTLAAPAALAQCSMCKESLKEEEAKPLAEGFKWSIYGMLAMPFLLTGGIVVMIVRSERKVALRRALPPDPVA
jgi:hypothetical protein